MCYPDPKLPFDAIDDTIKAVFCLYDWQIYPKVKRLKLGVLALLQQK